MTAKQLLEIPPPVQLIDVRLADDFEARHLAGAVNNCVFEVAFPDRLGGCAPEKSRTTVICGHNDVSQEAAAAHGKLLRAGYSDVHILEGGLDAAVEAGFPLVEGKPLPPESELPDGEIAIDLEASHVGWTGRNLLKKHHGTVALSRGVMRFRHGRLQTAEFSVDLRKLECADLEGSDLHDVLVAHLQSDDFFDVENHPEAVFVVTKAEPISGAWHGAPDLHLAGSLTLAGETHPVEVDAATGLTPEGKPAAQAVFTIDRTRWGILYGSGGFFQRLAGHLVNDLVEIEVKIVGK
jgi:polyisoprenoid-binding protein YceI